MYYLNTWRQEHEHNKTRWPYHISTFFSFFWLGEEEILLNTYLERQLVNWLRSFICFVDWLAEIPTAKHHSFSEIILIVSLDTFFFS